MATMKISMYARSLTREVHFNVILPNDGTEDNDSTILQNGFKTLYLLHGYMGSENNWIEYTRIVELANKYKIAVVMPAGENKFYIDNPITREYFSQFIGNELVQKTREMFPLSPKREDTYIAGLSMGGYGAIVNGIRYSETFSSIGAFSAALIVDTMIKNAKEGAGDPLMDAVFLSSVFGPLENVKGGSADYKALIIAGKDSSRTLPDIYMACGSEDFLIQENLDFEQFLINEDVPHTCIIQSGMHNWEFWNQAIVDYLEYLDENFL